jgi:hypothetical protein
MIRHQPVRTVIDAVIEIVIDAVIVIAPRATIRRIVKGDRSPPR